MISLFLANIVGFIYLHWRTVVTIAGVLLVCLALYSFCGKKGSDINEREIREAQQEIEQRESEKLSNNLEKSNEVLSNTANGTRQAEANTKQATNKTYNADSEELKRKAGEAYR